MVKCLPKFDFFTVFLKNKNTIFKIKRSKVRDYAALIMLYTISLTCLNDGYIKSPTLECNNLITLSSMMYTISLTCRNDCYIKALSPECKM